VFGLREDLFVFIAVKDDRKSQNIAMI